MEVVVVLHNIRSLHNVGSIFRTADAAGVSQLYLCGITGTPVDRFGKVRNDVAKVALGAESNVPWEHAAKTVAVLKKLKKDGYKIIALEQSPKSIPYDKFRLPSWHSHGVRIVRIALIVGNEIRGLPLSVLKMADRIVEIPMHGQKESLNVAVAFGIVVFTLL